MGVFSTPLKTMKTFKKKEKLLKTIYPDPIPILAFLAAFNTSPPIALQLLQGALHPRQNLLQALGVQLGSQRPGGSPSLVTRDGQPHEMWVDSRGNLWETMGIVRLYQLLPSNIVAFAAQFSHRPILGHIHQWIQWLWFWYRWMMIDGLKDLAHFRI